MNLGVENETTEFKSSMSQLDKGIIGLTAMLNRHNHGTLYIGVDDNGNVIGMDVGAGTLETVRNRIRSFVQPQIVPEISRHETDDGKSYISVHVTGFNIPYSCDGRYYIRNVSSNESAGPDVVAQLHATDKSVTPETAELRKLEENIAKVTGHTLDGTAFRNQLNLVIDRNKLLVYNVSYDEVVRVLRTAFKDNQVSTLRSYQQYVPIGIAGREMTVNSVLEETLVKAQNDANNQEQAFIPLRELVKIVPDEDLKEITANRNGEYIPIRFYNVKDAPQLMEQVREVVDENKHWDVSFSGSYFSNRKMIGELTVILLISILLMYFILCAQFESFLQPLIVLAEIPIDIAFGMVLLWALGHSLNLMSAIGLIVSCGIVVNDSILKLDGINELRREGMPLMEAIHTAGHRRLRAIIMTTLTTVFAMVPLLFTSDMGSELQRPLSIAMIGTMMVGLVVSLFVIPLIYWLIYRKHETPNR